MGVCIFPIKIKEKTDKNDDEGVRLFNYEFEGVVHSKYEDGCYKVDYLSPQYDCISIPYSTYNQYRDMISKRMFGVLSEDIWTNIAKYKDEPFFEFINFSDCKGHIDADVCKNLLDDFKTYKDKIIPEDEHNQYFINFYEDYTKYLEIVVENDGVLVYS